MPRLRVKVDQQECTGEALCTGISPRFFEMITNAAGEHKAQVKGRDCKLNVEAVLDVTDDEYDEILEAAERCPPKAIYMWEVKAGGQEEQIYP